MGCQARPEIPDQEHLSIRKIWEVSARGFPSPRAEESQRPSNNLIQQLKAWEVCHLIPGFQTQVLGLHHRVLQIVWEVPVCRGTGLACHLAHLDYLQELVLVCLLEQVLECLLEQALECHLEVLECHLEQDLECHLEALECNLEAQGCRQGGPECHQEVRECLLVDLEDAECHLVDLKFLECLQVDHLCQGVGLVCPAGLECLQMEVGCNLEHLVVVWLLVKVYLLEDSPCLLEDQE